MYAFGDCTLDPARYVLRRGGAEQRVEPQVFAVLEHLVRNAGRVVTKDELLDAVWGTRYVTEAALTSRIRAARAAVGDDGDRQALIRTIRGRGYELVAEVRTSEGSAPSPSALPADAHAVFGRERLVADVVAGVRSGQLVTLTGPGGVGKTTVARAVARAVEPAYADGADLVELVTVDAPSMLAAVATALGVQRRRNVGLGDAVLNVLRARRSLLLLDNCEHLVEEVAALVERVLESASGVALLATSRRPLAVRGEHIRPVQPLPIDPDAPLGSPAVELFVERARAVNPALELAPGQVETVRRICQRLDGMPLAIELAAARTATASVEEIEGHLDARFRLLRGVRRGGDPRHRALEDTVRWSYDLLDPDDRRRFDRLAIFAGPFDVAAAAAIGEEPDELAALDGVSRLAEASMLVVRRMPGEPARYELLETLRAFGREALSDDERGVLAARHAAFHVRLACEIEQGCGTADEPAAVARARAAFPDLRAALRFAVRRGDVDAALTLVAALREPAMRTMRYEALGWADDAAGVEGAAAHPLFPTVRGVQAYAAWLRGDFDGALALADEAARLETAAGVRSGLAERSRVNVLGVQGDLDGALAAGRRQLELAEESGHRSRVVHALYMLSIALNSAADAEEPLAHARRAGEVADATGSPTDRARSLTAIGFATRGDAAEAIGVFAESERLAREAGNRWLATFARTELAALRLLQGDATAAAAGLAATVDTWYRAAEWSQTWVTLARCVLALEAQGEAGLAAETMGAVEARAAMGMPPVAAALRPSMLAVGDALRARLGEEAFAAAHARGQVASTADVVQRVRAVLAGRAP